LRNVAIIGRLWVRGHGILCCAPRRRLWPLPQQEGAWIALLCALSIQGRIARYNRVTKSLLGQNAAAAANESDDQGYRIRPTVTSRAVVPLAEKCSSLPATFPFPSTLVLPVDPVETQASGSRVRKKGIAPATAPDGCGIGRCPSGCFRPGVHMLF
jgi:hypothetical protein